MSDVPSDATDDVRRWRHGLRNELNIITMATAAALGLIDHGASIEQVRENLVRATNACRRCHDLLQEWPDRD